MEYLWFIAFLVGILFRCISLYFGGIACFAVKKETPYPPAKTQRRFAMVTAARNEEKVICGFVNSMQAMDYPKELFDIYVIPNNCTDRTEEAAVQAGAKIIHCPYPVGNKGDALHQAFAQLKDKGYDGFCVFDSDNQVQADFLTHINNAFDAGARVAKARLVAQNPHVSWVAGCYSIYFDLFHLFFNRPRMTLGLSAKLVGTGFAVHNDVLKEIGGWNTTTIAEDAEFSSFCAQKGERIWWVPDAVTYDEQPTSFRVSLKQRYRWCSGIMQVAGVRMGALIKHMNKENLPLSLDFIFFLLAPFAQALSLLPLGLGVLAAVLEGGSGMKEFLWIAWAYFPCYYIALTAVAACLVLWQNGGSIPKPMHKAIFLFPVFMLSWIPLQIMSLCKKAKKWEEIRHTGKMQTSTLTH